MDSKYVYLIIREWDTYTDLGWDIVSVCHSQQLAKDVLAEEALETFKVWDELFPFKYTVVETTEFYLEVKYGDNYEKVYVETREVL